ncbi:unnamed protein product (macronuclear) [Paramecium tetraurelia]|uniref:PAS domain-containing protein n=1 Tax=Paramecium tetraurelia TaxID=5888 RepID=A0E430_PARTE|nr:uncharacterized protein GSPATT00023220001 [Paramecium tetraurelia]CAK90047.1 unnamed protein product [Paramecium tetraurelia]|eukprot:XP_001457444.1 hypothetical protein (macronuclear) [Paramecium tetraurelia strain d4-2]
MICQNNQSLQISIILAAVQFLQLLYFPFQSQIKYAWYNHKLSSQIQEFLSYFTIIRMLINQSTSLYLMVMYFIISIILLTTLLIIILTIQKSLYNQKVIILFLAKSIQFIMSIGFAEILRILLGYLLCQPDQNGILKMVYLVDQECWVGDYYYHAIFVIISLLLFIFFVIICSKLFIELRNNKKNTFSQREGISYSYLFIYIIFSMASYSLFQLPKYSICVIAIQNITSFIFFYRMYYKHPFYNQTVQKIWISISGLVFHTNLMQLMAFLFNHLIVQNSMLGWLITCPMAIVIFLGRQNHQIDLIKINLARYQSTENIVKDCEYLVELADSYEKDQTKEIQVLGFLEMHESTCLQANCAIKINKNLAMKFQENPKYTDERLIFKELINQLYQNGINKYPQSIDLRIHYSYFLYDHLADGQKALHELVKAEQLNPDFGQQFQIFSMKKILEDSFSKTFFGVNTLEYSVSIDRNIQFQQSQLKQRILEGSYQMLQFWNQLLEEIPNLTVLSILGRKVLGSIQQIRKQITLMQKTNTFNQSTKKLICKFSDYVFYMSDTMKFAKININYQSDEVNYQSKFLDQNNLLGSQDLSSYSQPVIVLELFSNNNQNSIVKNINQATCSLLGFSRTDIIGHSICQLFQSNYSKLHQYVVQRYFTSDSQVQLSILPQRYQFFKTKSQYVILAQSASSILQTEKGVFQFLRLTTDVNYRNYAYIIFNGDGKIENISASCISILKLDIRKLQLKQLNIEQLFPNLLSNKETYFNKMNKIVYEYHKSKVKSLNFVVYEKEKRKQIGFMVQLFEISDKNLYNKKEEKQQIFGYYLKIEQIEHKLVNNSPKIKTKQTTKEFTYSIEQRAFIYGNANSLQDSVKEDNEIQVVSKQKTIFQPKKLSKKQNSSLKQDQNQMSYGFDIKTLRLFQGKIQEIIDPNQEEDDDDNVKDNTEHSKTEIIIDKNQSNQINTQNDLSLYLQNIPYPTFLRRLVLLNNILLLVLFAISCIMYSTLYVTFLKFKNAVELGAASNQRFSSLMKIQSNLQDLRGCNLNIEALEQQKIGDEFININFLELKNELNLLLEQNNLLTSSDLTINQNYQTYISEFEEPQIQMFSVDNSYQNFTYSQAVQQLIARAITLNNSELSKFIDNNEDFHYFVHNTFNSIAKYEYVSQNYYFSNIYSLLDDLKTFEDVFFILSSSCVLLIFFFCQFYLHSHQSYMRNIISAFLEIKEQSLKQIVSKIRNFLQMLQTTDDDDVDQFDLEQNENQEEQELEELTKNSKKRKFKYSSESENKIQIRIIFVSLLFYSYFCYLYFSSTTIISYSNLLIPLVNITSYIPSQYRLIDNSIKEMLYDSEAMIMNELNSIDKMNYLIDEIQALDAELHILNQKNEHILSAEYIQLFNEIYILSPCTIIIEYDQSVTNASCLSFNENILKDGLAVAISSFFENACKMVQEYYYYDPNAIYSNLTYNLSSNHKKNFTYNILNTRDSNDNRQMQKVFIRICHLQLMKELLNQLNNYFSFLAFQLTLLFMIFCIIAVFTHFLIWIPILANFYQEAQKNLETLTIIPVEDLNKCVQIQEHLKNLKELNQ